MRHPNKALRLYKADLFAAMATEGFEATARRLNGEAQEHKADVLLGYSLGGRVALHMLLEARHMWRAAIIVAADSGFEDDGLRPARLKQDRRWGQRFLSEDSEVVMADWDAQTVFAGFANPLPRASLDARRVALAFDALSKARQRNLLPDLAKLSRPPILFISGEHDLRYTDIGVKLSRQCPAIEHQVIANSAHRVPWEQEEAFAEVVSAFLRVYG